MIKRQGADGSLQIDDGLEAFSTSPGSTQSLNTRGNIYVGGLPNPIKMTHGKFSDGFIGCVHGIQVQGGEPINLNDNAVSAVNVGPCST